MLNKPTVSSDDGRCMHLGGSMSEASPSLQGQTRPTVGVEQDTLVGLFPLM